ncbi:MAG: YdcF family protein [Eubacterium sp.]
MKKLSKGNLILKILFIAVGVLLLLWYFASLLTITFNVGNLFGMIGSSLLIAFGIFYNGIPPVLKKSIFIAMALFLAVVILPISFNMVKYANYKTDAGAQTVIVLGCKVNGSTPSRYLYDRCRKAASYLNENPSAVAVLSGGQGSDEAISEAQCMENVLVNMGIDKSRLFKEEASTSTSENISFSKQVIAEHNLSKSVLIVTNEFHQFRAKLNCDKNGLEFHSSCSYSSLATFLSYYTREILAISKEVLIG